MYWIYPANRRWQKSSRGSRFARVNGQLSRAGFPSTCSIPSASARPVSPSALRLTLPSRPVDGIPLRESLRLILHPLGLAYRVKDGSIMITVRDRDEDAESEE